MRFASISGMHAVGLLVVTAAACGAQSATGDTTRVTAPATMPDSTHTADARGGAHVAATAGLILLGASGAQTIKTPKAWPRTIAGFGQRVADQTGFYVVQTGSQRLLSSALGLHADEMPCADRALLPLAGCAITRTFSARDERGARRAPIPFVVSVATATAASVLWRPERQNASEARAFVATRLGVVFAGYAAERFLVEWRRGRGRPR